MVKDMTELPIAPFKRIVQKAGGARVSADAAEALREVVEDIAMDLAAKASRLSEHAGRKTVSASDIKLASKSE